MTELRRKVYPVTSKLEDDVKSLKEQYPGGLDKVEYAVDLMMEAIGELEHGGIDVPEGSTLEKEAATVLNWTMYLLISADAEFGSK